MRRHPGYTAAQVALRLPADNPAHAEVRTRLLDSLRALGLRD
jgi:hypothetical protein